MPEEICQFLGPAPGRLMLDLTLGGGGHTERLLERGAEVVGVDQDLAAIRHASERLARFGDRFLALRANFRNIGAILDACGVAAVDGILADVGTSSRQMEDVSRGFSFMAEAPLDMRMDPDGELTAEAIVNTYAEAEIAEILWRFGDERASRRIAAAICRERAKAPIESTLQLASIIERVVPRRGKAHPSTRSFQALRIAVNDELGALRDLLEVAPKWLRRGGRIAILTFHSLEDKLVKGAFRRMGQPEIDRPEWPQPKLNPEYYYEPVLRKALPPPPEEIAQNPRARSAKLRVMERNARPFAGAEISPPDPPNRIPKHML